MTERFIILAAKLVAPNVEAPPVLTEAGAPSTGYDWVVDTIKNSPHADIAFELEIAKAVQFLKAKEFAKVIKRELSGHLNISNFLTPPCPLLGH